MFAFQIEEKKFTVEELTDTAGDLEQLSAGGNVKEAASLVLSLAKVLDTKEDEADLGDKEQITKVDNFLPSVIDTSLLGACQSIYVWYIPNGHQSGPS